MSYDLVIRGGTVIDGSGAPARTADVAVRDGIIVEVGHLDGSAGQEIEADGAIVTPGFVDIHTHYDGQVVWDERLTPSSLHGVTTVVMGNCGVGFAPVRPEHRELLIELMAGVEDIPEPVLEAGIDWVWESFDDYLRFLGSRHYDTDIAAQLPHAPLRVFVMGERAAALETATTDDIAQMRTLARAAIRAGAIGFSTSRSMNHRSVKGAPTPSLRAGEDELMGIARGVAEGGGAVLEISTDFAENFDQEFAMLTRISTDTGLPWSFGLAQHNSAPDRWKNILSSIVEANASGARFAAQVTPRPIGAIITIESSSNPFQLSPTYKALTANGTPRHVMAQLRQPAIRDQVFQDLAPHLEGKWLGRFGGYERVFVQQGQVDYEPARHTSLGVVAARAGRKPLDLLYELLHAGDGGAFVYFAVTNFTDFNFSAIREMIQHDATLPGLSDGGAHVSVIGDASFPTYLLTRWTKTHNTDGFDLEWIVKHQTADTAHYIGLHDRGLLKPGMKADINVIDLDHLSISEPVIVHDLPAHGRRLLQGATGYVATIVNGQTVTRHDNPTGALPGQLVKRG